MRGWRWSLSIPGRQSQHPQYVVAALADVAQAGKPLLGPS
jgi:hypothetical protein